MDNFDLRDAEKTASQFADMIASGQWTVASSFERVWSFAEDKSFWNMESFEDARTRALHPLWAPVLAHLARIGDQAILDDLLVVLTANYFHYGDRLGDRLAGEARREWMDYALDAGLDALRHAEPEVERIRRVIAEADYYNPFTFDLVTAADLPGPRTPSPTLAGLHARVREQARKLQFTVAYPGLPRYCADREVERNPYHLEPVRRQSDEEREATVREWEGHVADKNTPYRRDSMRYLAIVDPRRAVPLLTRCVRDPDDPDRGVAIRELGETRVSDPEAAAALIDCVRDRHDRRDPDRWRAVTALGKLGVSSARQPLLEYLADESNPRRERAAIALGALEAKEAIPALIGLLERRWGEDFSRLDVAWALVRIGGSEVVEALRGSLTASDPTVRRDAGETLAEIGGPDAIKALLAASRTQSDPAIQGFVYYAHDRCKRQRLGIADSPNRRFGA